MTAIIRMETEQVGAVSKRLAAASQEISQDIQLLMQQVQSIPWQGPSRDEFVVQFEQIARRILHLTEESTLLASRVEREAMEWEQVDSNFGVGTGLVPGDISPGLTTQAIGEEGQYHPFPNTPQLGEQQQEAPPGFTTEALGEEGQQMFPPHTSELGEKPEEPPRVTTLAEGEEGQQQFPRTNETGEIPFNPPNATTMAVGEEGQQIDLDDLIRRQIDDGLTWASAGSEQGMLPDDFREKLIEVIGDQNSFYGGGGESGFAPSDTSQIEDLIEKLRSDLARPSTMMVGEEGQQPPIQDYLKELLENTEFMDYLNSRPGKLSS